ncbi:all trans-polyprenyl-diphosphate synthase PDSS2-like [Anopheles nili]|uniref:all trans-polyprenyl-diphosphate synthase PDSS2-like n=1 Tax=Anopheles nili TaxID=185578 RepID=UPI00237B9D08|nr:all trans-polyprenyl-diphosphate synthase PDSS2-like [Anopheles nili]
MSLNRIYGVQARLWVQLQQNMVQLTTRTMASDSRRWVSSGTTNHEKLAPKTVPKHDWNRAVSEAVKIVGYPASFLSLLQRDEIALHLRNLASSNHPLLEMAKDMVSTDKTNLQPYGLIVLLLSKAVGHAATVADLERDKCDGVLQLQRELAEITEMARSGHLMHHGFVNLPPLGEIGGKLNASEMAYGNKIALLIGDYLLGKSLLQLADLRNQHVFELISSAMRDMTEASFFGERDQQNNPVPSRPARDTFTGGEHGKLNFGDAEDNRQPFNVAGVIGNPEDEWALRHILGTGSLLGKSCQGALMLAKQPEDLQRHGYMFGKHISLAWQAGHDLEPFSSAQLPLGEKFSLVSAPVLFHLAYDPSLYDEIEKGLESIENVDFAKVHAEVRNGPGLEQTHELHKKYSIAALMVLNELPASDARTALENIILAMQDI